MKTDVFDRPVLVNDDPFGMRAIGCAMEAIEFLEEWPFEKRGNLHLRASEACCAAYDGRIPASVARQVLLAWARSEGIAQGQSLLIEA